MKKIILFLLMFIIITSCAQPERSSAMAIDFTNVAGQKIDYGGLAAARISVLSIYSHVDIDSYGAGGDIFSLYQLGATDSLRYIFGLDTSGRAFFTFAFTSATGFWRTTSAVGTGHRSLSVSYNGSSTANDPIIYVDGASVAITEVIAPSGTIPAGTDTSLAIGGFDGAEPSIDGRVHNLLEYNRILSDAEFVNAQNSRLLIPIRNGLVFAPNMLGTAGGLKDGDTMGAGNTIRDIVSGVDGVPAGSPVFRINNFLRIGGE